MKLLIIYVLTWFLVAAAAGVVYLTGSFNGLMLNVFGFIASSLFFAGLVALLPFWIDERHSWKY